MIRNYFITTLRNLYRNKIFTLINLFGFATGIACVILFFLWVSDEVSYDRFHDNKERTYNLLSIFARGEGNSMSVTPFPLAPTLSERFPEVESYTRYWQFPSLVTFDEENHMDEKIHLVDPGFLEMFSFPTVRGNPGEALTNLSSVAIIESEAIKYFGSEDPIGKVLTFNQHLKLAVVAVLHDPPKNSVFDFTMLASIKHVPESRLYGDWTYAGPSYIMLAGGSNWRTFEDKVKNIYTEFTNDSDVTVALQPLKDLYLYQDGKANRIIYVYMFSGIAVLILILACINYMNLSTARSLKRAKEIALRKCNGATRRQIITQFLGESMFYSLLSIFIALILVELVRPIFNALTLKQLELHYNDPKFLLGLLSIYLFTSILSGLYPAFVLSSFKPIQVMSGTGISGNKKILNSLIILQFTISIALIISSVTIGRQVNYIQDKDLGINKENIVVLPFGGDLIEMYDLLSDQLLSLPSVTNVSASYDLPFHLTSGVGLTWEGAGDEDAFGVSYNMVDYDFIETMEIEMLEGRTFSRDFASDDSIAYIINESAMKRMGVNHASGMNVHFTHPHLPVHLRKGKIVGVVKDFNIRPLREEIGPLVLRIYRPFYRKLYIRYDAENPSELLLALQEIQSQLYPGMPFNYTFLDQEFDQLYETEYRTGRIIKYFTIISIIISCMGLFGMALIDLELRTREIAIRKVLASSVTQIVELILKKYLRWIVISFLVASPLAFYTTQRWLREFAFGIRISPLTYLFALLAVITIAFLTLAFLSQKSARSNPARALKHN